jgi:hypothetical protein
MGFCVSAAGKVMTSFMVSSRGNNWVIDRLKCRPCLMGVNQILEHDQKPYLTAALFPQYTATLLIPFIDGLRINDEFTGKSRILRMDPSPSRTRRDVLPTLREHGLQVIPFPLPLTQIIQAFDLSLFGAFMKPMQQ